MSDWTKPGDTEFRDFTRRLFGRPAADVAPDESTEPPARSNVVPGEGQTPGTPPRDEMRDFTRRLFGYDD